MWKEHQHRTLNRLKNTHSKSFETRREKKTKPKKFQATEKDDQNGIGNQF